MNTANITSFLTEKDTTQQELERSNTLKAKREEFIKNMRKTIDEDVDGERFGRLTLKEHPDLLDNTGKLTPYFRDILRELKEEELQNIEEQIANARVPTEDIFGLKRRLCSVCEQGCIGYEPHTILFPGAKKSQFPTFCKNCECPAFFHMLADNPKDIKFPEDLAELIKNYNIRSKDVNFNCIMVAFQIRDVDKEAQNINELMLLMKEEGFEVLSVDKRQLEFEEAIYLKSRIVSQTENIMLKDQGFSKQTKIGEINKQGEMGSSTMNIQAKRDPYLMDQYADQKEVKLQKVQQTLMGQKGANVTHIDGVLLEKQQNLKSSLKQQVTDLNKLSINQRVSFNVPYNRDPSIARTSEWSENDEFLASQAQLNLTLTLLPSKKDKQFKIKNYAKNKDQKKSAILTTIPEELQMTQLNIAFEQNPLLKELISKEVFVVAMGSHQFQNLESKIRGNTMTKIQGLLPPHEMPLLYVSENKIMALEDTITFFPQLFRLTKSIIISEPIKDFNPDGNDAVLESMMFQNQDTIRAHEAISEKAGVKIDSEIFNKIEESKSELDNKSDHYFTKKRALTRKLTVQMRTSLKQRNTLRNNISQSQVLNQTEISRLSFPEQIKYKEKIQRKQKKLAFQKNQVLYNYGVMQDFFLYSAMSIQESAKEIDGNKFMGRQTSIGEQVDKELSYKGGCNAFAIAKVGLPNIVFPNSLDIRFSNYQSYSSYLYLSDQFFPTIGKSQHTVFVLRPIIVKNGLNDSFVQILKANDFIILKRKIRILRKPEIAFLAKNEGITETNAELYFNLMTEGQSEVIVATKLGAVFDGQSIANGPNPYGRRRIAQLKEDSQNIRTNVDSVNSMFEITPFTSFNEFLDLEDFMVGHSRLEKYRKLKEKTNQVNRLDNQLYFYKIEAIKREINIFSRFFNVVSYASESEYDAHKQMCVLMPETAKLEEVILILNPIYTNLLDSAEKLLERMNFKIINKKVTNLKQEKIEEIFQEKLNQNKVDQTLIEHLQHVCHFYHLTKISGEREVRQTFIEANLDYEDLFILQIKNPPFKPLHLPYIFLHMDTDYMFEKCLNILWPEQCVSYSGMDMIDTVKGKDKITILENILLTNVGDKIKLVHFDRDGKVLVEEQKKLDEHESLQGVNSRREPSYQVLYQNSQLPAVHYIVESAGHGLFEIRIHRLAHKGDSYNFVYDPTSVNILNLKQRYYTKFEALNFYYNEVNKRFYNICPAFYRYKIAPLVAQGECSHQLNRVYEIEEHMGRSFMEEIAKMHQDHLIMVQNNRNYLGWQFLAREQQKSLPPYIWGNRLAQLCKQLETVRGNDPDFLTGAGRLKIENGYMKGEVPKSSQYFQFDKNRYLKYLREMKKGWHYYFSVLETEIIEQKLMHILNSFTYKYSRMPQFLSLIPDKLGENNIRISEKIKVLTEKGLEEVEEKFFTLLKEQMIDPHREQIVHAQVQSIMHTLKVGATRQKLEESFKEQGTSLEEVMNKSTEKKQYSIHQDCSIVGVDVARRPRQQLLASMMYLINFYLRKIDRKSEMFRDLINKSYSEKNYEDDYDEVLDIIFDSLTENYGEDEYNLALDIVELKRGYENEFEQMMREKQEHEAQYRKQLQNRIYEEQRRLRTTMSLQELLQKNCYMPFKEYQLKQMNLLTKFVEERGRLDIQGDEFRNILNQTQAYMGPFSMKLAHDYIERSKKQEKTDQEKISFVKMEYFLYGIRESYQITQQLKHLENRLEGMIEKLEQMRARFGSLPVSQSFNQASHRQSTFKKTVTTQDQQRDEMNTLEEQIQRVRYTMSMKETEFVITLRELMAWDYFVPDHYFNLQLQMSKKQREEAKEQYLLPLKTFWLPVEGIEDPYEDNLWNEKYNIRLRDYKLEPPELFLPSALCRQPYTEFENQWKKQQGVIMSNLRPHDALNPNDQMTFAKFISKGEMSQYGEIDRLKQIIHHKTTREPYQPENPFQSEKGKE